MVNSTRQIHKCDGFTDQLTDGHQGSYGNYTSNDCCSRGDGREEGWTQYGVGGLGEGRGAERYEVTESRQAGPGWGVYRN